MHLRCFDFSTNVTNAFIDVITATGAVWQLNIKYYWPVLTSPTLISKSGLFNK